MGSKDGGLSKQVSAPMVGLAVAVNMALTLPDIVLVPVLPSVSPNRSRV
jgi:hypothetical protein